MAKWSRGNTVWLVTWEGIGDHAQRKERIAAIFKSQFSAERVRECRLLSRLERLAEKKSSSAASILLASFTGAVLLGLTLGLCHVAYTLIAHLAR